MAVQKKNSTTKTDSSSPSTTHPPYLQMISEAITTIKDRTGSSQPAIAKFIEENYAKQLPPNFRKILSIQLKRLVGSEKLVKVKNSYKISSTEKVKKPSNPVKEKTSPIPKKKTSNKPDPKVAIAKKSVEKAKKMKRLSQIKTPDALKKTKPAAGKKVKESKAATPVKRRTSSRPPPAKKAKN
ncbi:hypothetical protein ACJIZ3_011604 [Penstemon smallii]|uniref:H15 domain-containing protein n=1 Tax=Penstemon smallii TaxID=265156 RepID=A0ABD3UJQ8_9LAMI